MYKQRSTKKFEKPQNLTLKKAKLLSTNKPFYIVNLEYFARLLHSKRFGTQYQIRQQHLDTLKFVYNTYIRGYVSQGEKKQLRQGVIFGMGDIPPLAPFRTHLTSIATETMRSPRSAKDHRNRFFDCGLIETFLHNGPRSLSVLASQPDVPAAL